MNTPLSLLERLAQLAATLVFSVLVFAAAAAAAEKTVENFALYDEPKPISELKFKRGDGSPATLDAFRGKTVLLNVWATWCVPCRREMPTLDRLQATLGGPDFEVLALSIDRAGIEAVKRFYAEIGIKNLAVYIDQTGKATRTLKVVGLPTTLLIDRRGREVGALIGPAEWDTPEMVSFLRDQIAKSLKAEARSPERAAKK